MAVEVVQCPHCQSKEVVKYGTASNGKSGIGVTVAARSFVPIRILAASPR
jgi:hypothetical protein